MRFVVAMLAMLLTLALSAGVASAKYETGPLATDTSPSVTGDTWALEAHAVAEQESAAFGRGDQWAADAHAAAADATAPVAAAPELPATVSDDGLSLLMYMLIALGAAALLGGAIIVGVRHRAHRMPHAA